MDMWMDLCPLLLKKIYEVTENRLTYESPVCFDYLITESECQFIFTFF